MKMVKYVTSCSEWYVFILVLGIWISVISSVNIVKQSMQSQSLLFPYVNDKPLRESITRE